MRSEFQEYPDYTSEIAAIKEGGISTELLYRIIEKHQPNSQYNKELHKRYKALDACVPIFNREPRFSDPSEAAPPINNKINNDFFGEIIDFKTGYFAGKAIAYSYSDAKESEDMTGGENAVEDASKLLTDFVTRNNMFDKDMEMTKKAAICGYCGRLLYLDEEGEIRVKILGGDQTIILSSTSITEPYCAVRYYSILDIEDKEVWKVEYYDSQSVKYYEGDLSKLAYLPDQDQDNYFGCCPLQGMPNNEEMIGDGEKVLAIIDAYDRTLSDNSNDIESFSSAYMVFENTTLKDEEFQKMQESGAIQFRTGAGGGRLYFLTKEVNDTYVENHLKRLNDNIYRFSTTPNLNDETFGSASGISLKFKLTGLEAKCGMFQAKVISAGRYMFKLLASAWEKQQIKVDPLQCMMDFKRNFPLDLLNEAQTVQALVNAGLPQEVAFTVALSCIDDIDWVMQLIEEEKNNIPSLSDNIPGDEKSLSLPQEVTKKKLNGVQTNLIMNTVKLIQSKELTLEEGIDIIERGTDMTRDEIEQINLVQRVSTKVGA